MLLEDFLTAEGRKIIITDRVGNANKLMRRFARKTGSAVMECTALSLQQIARELVAADLAMQGKQAPELIDNSSRVMELTLLLKKGQYDFLKDNTKEISTSTEILRSLDQIRLNPVTPAFETDSERKLLELKAILNEYEAHLEQRNETDYPMLLQKALQVLDRLEGTEDGEQLLKFMLPWLADGRLCRLAVRVGDAQQPKLEMEERGYEKQFLEKLCAVSKAELPICEYGRAAEQGEAHFVRAYGIANEVRYLADTIESKGVPFGEVSIMYAGAPYENFLAAELDSRGIPYTFPRGFNAANSHYVQLILSILEFASADFDFARLAPVLKNPVFCLKGCRSSFRYVNDAGIGWGRQRYYEFFERYAGLPEDDRLKKYDIPLFVEFLKKLMDALDPDGETDAVFHSIWKLAAEYSFPGDAGRNAMKAELESQTRVYSLVKEKNFNRNLHWFTEYFTSVKLRCGEQPGAVTILPYGSREIIDRKYWFVLGLSTENIAATNAESPVLNDTELRRYIAGDRVHYALEKNREKREAFEKTHAAFYGEEVTFSYSSYDTVALLENSKSILYDDLLALYGRTEEAVEVVGYTIPNEDKKLTVTVEDLTVYGEESAEADAGEKPDQSAAAETKAEEAAEEEKPTGSFFSPSSLQTLLNCPLSYYYQKILRIKLPDFRNRVADTWLPANARGNVFHHVLEQYIKIAVAEKKTVADAGLMKRLFDEEIEKARILYPIPSEDIFRDTAEEIFTGIDAYIIAMHANQNLSDRGEKLIDSEVPFTSFAVKGQMPESGEFTLLFTGSVDRLDGYIDEASVLHLLIYDYKTGDMTRLSKKIHKWLQIQHCIYAPAMKDWAEREENKAKVEAILGKPYESVVVDQVAYDFPFEPAPDNQIVVTEGIMELPEYVMDWLQKTEGYYQSGDTEKLILSTEELTKQRIDEENSGEIRERKDLCEYCKYAPVCRVKIME